MTEKKLPQPGEFWRTRGGKLALVGAKNESADVESRLIGWTKEPHGRYAVWAWRRSGHCHFYTETRDDLVEHLPDRTSWDDPKPKRREWHFGGIPLREVLPGDPDPEAVERLIEAVGEYLDSDSPYVTSCGDDARNMALALAAVRQSQK